MKIRLIKEWKKAGRMWSMRFLALATALLSFYEELPQDFKEALPPGLMKYLVISLLILVAVSRLILQETLKEPEE